MGVLCGREDELLNAMPPFLTGGEMIDSVTRAGRHLGAVSPQKFEAGTVRTRRDAVGHGMRRSTYVESRSDSTAIASAKRSRVTRRAMDAIGAAAATSTCIGSPRQARGAPCGVISFNGATVIHPHDVGEHPRRAIGVAIRAGHHCAQPLLTWLGVENLACCRASLAFYNDKGDVDKLIAGLKNVWSTFNG